MLERERQTIEKGRAKIDPIYIDKINEKLGSSRLGAALTGSVQRKPVVAPSAGGNVAAAGQSVRGDAIHQQFSELEG